MSFGNMHKRTTSNLPVFNWQRPRMPAVSYDGGLPLQRCLGKKIIGN